MSAKELFKQSHLGLSLIPFTIRELFSLATCPCDIYIFENGAFSLKLKKSAFLNNTILKELISDGHTKVFAKENERQEIVDIQQQNLRTVTRSFSMGNSFENCKRQLSLLSLNMRYLFEDPTNDDTLNLQYQSLKILYKYLFDNPKKHEALFQDYMKQGHHYIFAQPFLSSLFLIGVLKFSHLYSEKDIENLFITSYFKDIGMSAIPIDKYDLEDLTENDKSILSNHADLSVQILQGRLQISPAHFKIIEAHHSFSTLRSEMISPVQTMNDLTVSGFETMIVSITDIVSAMISNRPYRKPTSLFEALDLVKALMSHQYPQEFKIIVTYFRNFFTNTVG